MNETRGLWRGKTMPKYNGEEFNEVWVEGDLIHSENRYYIHPVANAVKVQNELGKLIIMHEVDPSTLGKCTGLTDKNGKLIFEGDIVEIKGNIGRVIFVDDEAGFVIDTDEKYFTMSFSSECEAIGNIHDNPELLKGENQ